MKTASVIDPAHSISKTIGILSEQVTREKTKLEEISAFDMLVRYRPYMERLMKNKSDAEDLEQEVNIKLLKNYEKDPVWWDKIDNKRSYMYMTITHAALDLLHKLSNRSLISYDDTNNNALQREVNSVSDKWQFVAELYENMDHEKFRLQLRNLFKDFSPYEQRLVWLNYFEGVKPRRVAEILKKIYPDKDTKVITSDCNTAKAKFLARLKVMLKKYQ